MMAPPTTKIGNQDVPPRPSRPFRRAVWRGLAIVTPPLLTIVIFFWVGGTVQNYVLRPITAGARSALVWYWADIRTDEELPQLTPTGQRGEYESQGQFYRRIANEGYRADDPESDAYVYIPADVYHTVRDADGPDQLPSTGHAIYARWVEITFLRPYIVVPLFLVAFVFAMYLLGRFLAAGLGRVVWNLFERGIHQLPLISNVYGSVKQVSDFVFTESELEYTRVVAVEYPRKGIWSLGLATGEGMLDIQVAAGEPMLSILIPSSPMPITGYTITVPKSETIDLNITIDQAFQFCISCGVVVPPHQLSSLGKGPQLPRLDTTADGVGSAQRSGDASRRAIQTSPSD